MEANHESSAYLFACSVEFLVVVFVLVFAAFVCRLVTKGGSAITVRGKTGNKRFGDETSFAK
jgi:hypothetical protein